MTDRASATATSNAKERVLVNMLGIMSCSKNRDA